MIRAGRNCLRTLGALLVCFTASTAFASAGITVNKAFAPNSIALGATSVVTVTLQNDSTSSAATITAFSDNIGTTMAGHASLLSSPAPTTTCSGGTPTAAGQVLSMSNGQIPIAPSVSTPGSCTITFSVTGTVSGNGFNTIAAANVVTSLGSPGADVTQTLNVQSANVTAIASSTGTVQTNDTNTVTFVLTNPVAVPLTSVAFPITSSAALAYTVSGYTTSCGGTATLPAALGTTGTTSFSGLTIPASGTCTVTLSVTSPNSTTATLTLNTGAVSDAQGATNGTFVSTTAIFKTGKPAIAKAFSPSGVGAGGTTTLTLSIPNPLTIKPLTNAAISDTLPGSLTIVGTPTANANCGSPTLGGTGTGTLTFSGGTIAANSTCSITAIVNVPAGQAAGTLTNTVPAANFTSTEVGVASGAATANLFVTAGGGGVTTSQSVTPTSANVGVAMKITLNFTSVGAALTAGSFTDVLPQTVQPMAALTDAGHMPTFSAGCGSNSPAVTFGGTGGNTTVSGSNLNLTSGGTCAVGFWVAFTTATSTTQADTNTLVASNVSFTGSAGTIHAAADSTVVLMQVPTFSINNYLVANSGLAGQPLTVNATLYDSTGTADTNAVMVVNLTAGKIQLAPTPNFTFAGCPAGFSAANIAINGAREQFTATLGSINATCSIGYDVINETGITGTFAPTNSTYKSTLTGGTAIASTATNNVTFATTTINLTKAFSPNQIQSGGNSTADITLTVPQAGALAITQANGVAFSDALPANVTFSPTPNVTFTGCAKSGQPAPTFSISGTTISLSNLTLVTTNATQTACDVKFDVTSSVVGAPLNQIAASAVTSASGITNTQNALASLTVNSGLGIAKTFLNPSFAIGGTDYVRFLVTNSASSTALSGGTIVDAMPSTLVLASTTLGAIQAGDPVLCGGSVAGPVGTGTLNLSGLAVAGLTSPTAPGQCVVYVQVKASASAAPGSVSNTIAAGGLNVGGYINQTAATGSVTLTAPPNDTVSKTFTPALIVPGAASVLSIVIDNTAVGAATLSGMVLTDTLPTGVQIAATPNASTTCGAGTLTAIAATATVALTSGSVAANATCTITVSVTGTGGTFTNTIAANALTTTQGATNAAGATATLTVASVTLSKAFLPTTISAGGSSTLTITIPNGTTALTGVALTDTLPTGVTIAAAANAATTCPSGSVAATPGGSSVALTGGTLAASSTCTITADVTGTAAATYTNTIAANALHTTQTITNPTAATANLTIGLAGITLSKTFAPATIAAGGTSVLTITISNTAPGAVSLSGVALTDALPSGITIAAAPNAVTTCASGTVTAVAGGASVALASATVAANATCTITVSVTGTVAASYTNTILANALSTTQGVTNPAAATAPLTITPAGITLSKAFAPASIVAGGTAILTITIPNTATGAVSLSGVALTDTLPSGVTIAATPNAGTTCPAGTVTAVAGGTSVALVAGTLAANATCTITVAVTGTVAASYTNTINASALSTTQGVSNAAASTAPLSITPGGVTLTKAFVPASIVAGGTSILTITIPNTATGAVSLSGVALTDTLPSGLTIAATPNAATTCTAGTVTAAAGGTSVALAAGTLAANATCTITVSVTGTVAASYTNTILASALSTTQGVANDTAATASLSVTPAGINLSKAFSPATIIAGGTSLLTITIPNTATGAVSLSGMALTDTLPSGVTIAATPNAATTCPAGTLTAAAGGTSVVLASGTLAANATCTITVNVTGTVAASYTNTILPSALSTTQGVSNAGAATAPLNVTPAGTTLSKAFAPTSIVAGGTSLLTITIPNTAAGAVSLSGMALTDTLPSGVTIAATPNAATTCPAGTVTANAGGASVALANGTLAANAACTITVNVTGTVAASYSNSILANALSTTQGVSNAVAATAPLTITLGSVSLSKTFAPASIVAGSMSTLTITIANTAAGAVSLSGMTLSDGLPSGITIAAAPNATTTCTSGTVTAIAGGANVALAGGTLAANASCTIGVRVTGTAVGSYLNTIAAHALTNTQSVSNAAPATATIDITSVPDVTLTKAFSPASVLQGATSLLTVTVNNAASSSVPLSGLAFSDAYPAGLVNAATPAAGTTCPAGGVTAVAGAAALALSGATLAANTSCTITVNVVAPIGTYSNTVSSLTTTQGATNVAAATASLSVTAASTPTITNSYAPPSILTGGISTLTITIANTGTNAIALGNVALTDTLLAGVTIAPIPNAATTCLSGAVSGSAGGSALMLAGASLAAGTTCTLTVDVTSASVGAHTNTIAANALSDTQLISNASPASATLTVGAISPVTILDAFSPPSIASGQTSLLTISIANTGSSAAALSGVTLADALPSGMTLAATPAGTTTCVGGSVTAAAGATSVSLGGATLAAGASCSITVNVTSTTLGPAIDTIPVSAFGNTQSVPSVAQVSATLTVSAAPTVTLTQVFAPATIVAGTTSVLTLSLANTTAGAVALTGVALSDALPAGVAIAGLPNASTTCPAGTLTASAGAASFGLSTATLGANATCTVTVSVSAAAAGAFANAIAAGALTSSQGATNAATTATLTVTAPAAPPLTLTKGFAPATIVSPGVSTLTVTIGNGASGAIALTSLAFSDTLPAGVVIAATPNAGTTCGTGTAASYAGGATLALTNGTLAAGATCTVSVNVTSSVPGSHLDTSAIGAVSDTQNISNLAAASASLTVSTPAALALTQAFTPAAISAGATSVLTLTFANTGAGAIPLSALAFAGTLPAGVVLVATPSASTSCAGATVTAAAGASTFALSAATLAANATCTIVVTVTASGAGSYANSIPAAAVSDVQNVTNAATQATLTAAADSALRVTKTSDVAGAGVAVGQTIAYTVTIVNPGTTLVTGAKLSDVLTNATLVPNSVTLGGVVVPDAIVKAGAPFGPIAAGATVVIGYRVTVNPGAPNGTQVTNTATAGSDQGCAGAACSGTAPADAVLSAPKVDVSLLIDGKVNVTVALGQVVLYSATLTNVGGISAQNVTLTDTLPPGVTPIPGSVTVSNGASASTTSRTRSLASAVATTASGQSVTASLGTIAAGASATVEFRATITAPIAKVAANTVTVAATGIPTAVTSNVVVARMVRATLTITKSASAVVAQIGDRVDYNVRITGPAGIPFAQTTIVDRLPDYLSYAPGSARINGLASVPAVAGHTLTWTLPSLGVAVSLTYATSIAAGVAANATLNNLVTVSAAPIAGGPPGGGSASAAIQIAASTFGTCYPITGRVYDDVKGSGRFESGDKGLAGVSIVLDDGESVVTDAHGRYNFPCVRQGMHALRLDEKTLPDGSVPFPDRAIDSERSIHRLVHGIFDDTILQDVNFAVTQRAP